MNNAAGAPYIVTNIKVIKVTKNQSKLRRKKWVLRRWWKVDSLLASRTALGRSFQARAAATANARVSHSTETMNMSIHVHQLT